MLEGICTPVCTPFSRKDQKIDDNLFLKHIDWIVENKVDIICVAGGTGEFAYLSEDERKHLAQLAAKQINGKAKLIIQTSAIRTEDAIEKAKHAEGLGADAIMVLPPFFEGPGDDGVFKHYEAIANAVKTPIMLYNIPACSNYDIVPSMYKRLSQLPTVQYIKDSTGDFTRLEELVELGAKVFCGWDTMMPFGLLAGAVGCFWGTSNIIPAEAAKLYECYKNNKIDEMLTVWEKIKLLNLHLITNKFVPGVKATLKLIGRDLGDCRFPMETLSQDEINDLEKIIKNMI